MFREDTNLMFREDTNHGERCNTVFSGNFLNRPTTIYWLKYKGVDDNFVTARIESTVLLKILLFIQLYLTQGIS